MYTVTTDEQTQQQLEALPADALAPFAELRAMLEIAPWHGDPYNRFKPDSSMRTRTFGPNGEGIDHRRSSTLGSDASSCPKVISSPVTSWRR